jgi:hypothetical protein
LHLAALIPGHPLLQVVAPEIQLEGGRELVVYKVRVAAAEEQHQAVPGEVEWTVTRRWADQRWGWEMEQRARP